MIRIQFSDWMILFYTCMKTPLSSREVTEMIGEYLTTCLFWLFCFLDFFIHAKWSYPHTTTEELEKNCTCFWKGWIRSSTPVIDVCSIYDWLPDVTTSPTGTSNVLAMNPKTLNTTNPAKKLVPQFITLTMIASLWITKEYIRSL